MLCAQFEACLLELVNKCKVSAAALSAMKLNAGVLQNVKAGDERVGKLCSVHRLSNGDLMLRPFNKDCAKRVALAVSLANTMYDVEHCSDGVVVKLPKLTVQRRTLILAQLAAVLEDAKAAVRLARRRAVNRVKTAKYVGDDEKMAALKRLELDVVKAHAMLAAIGDSVKQKIVLD